MPEWISKVEITVTDIDVPAFLKCTLSIRRSVESAGNDIYAITSVQSSLCVKSLILYNCSFTHFVTDTVRSRFTGLCKNIGRYNK